MSQAILYYVLGVIGLVVGIWWWTVVGRSFAFLAPLLVMSAGGAFAVAGWAATRDVCAPTSRMIEELSVTLLRAYCGLRRASPRQPHCVVRRPRRCAYAQRPPGGGTGAGRQARSRRVPPNLHNI